MTEKVEQLRRLLEEGFVIDDIDSEDGAVQTTLRRDTRLVVLRFTPSEAEELLLDTRPFR